MASKSGGVRIPPQDIEAEKALLGSVMLRPDQLPEVLDLIPLGAFYLDKHNSIYATMRDLYTLGHPIDLLSLSSKLREQNKLDKVGGSSYLTDLINLVPSAANIMHYAELVAKKNTLRNLIYAADHISELSYNGDEDVESVLDKAGKKLLDIAGYSKHKFTSLKDTLMEAWERLDRLHKSKDEMRGVPTGFPDLDNKLAGLQKSDLIILAARPSMGKTSLALDIARNTALKHGTTVGIFSLEMSSAQLVDRLLAAESRVDSWKLRTGKLSADEDFSRIRDSLDKLSKAPIFIDDDSYIDMLRMKGVARRLKNDHNLGLIIVDYLQLLVPRRNYDSLVQQVTEISRALKALARELEVPVLALSQLNRNVEQRGGKPRLSDLRDSGSIEQDADVVMFIHREESDKTEGSRKGNIAEILIEKHRNGPTGMVKLHFDEQRVTFSPMASQSFGEF
ncbi:MAG: replicative DNA helicase [Parcubacteria group bacterium RIFCSPHIGHO2_01_FULL_45_26]|nr:MAG: replicative DNA helicase [Parcubacteria group bacterium RIFCSPHIGHO2_01_FULL_45_26]